MSRGSGVSGILKLHTWMWISMRSQIQAERRNVGKRRRLVLLLHDPEQRNALPGEIAGVEREDRARFAPRAERP